MTRDKTCKTCAYYCDDGKGSSNHYCTKHNAKIVFEDKDLTITCSKYMEAVDFSRPITIFHQLWDAFHNRRDEEETTTFLIVKNNTTLKRKEYESKTTHKTKREGRNKITILSTTRTTNYRGSFITGMKYSYTGEEYADLFNFDETEDEVREKAMNIFLNKNIDEIRHRYKKYSRKFKENKL